MEGGCPSRARSHTLWGWILSRGELLSELGQRQAGGARSHALGCHPHRARLPRSRRCSLGCYYSGVCSARVPGGNPRGWPLQANAGYPYCLGELPEGFSWPWLPAQPTSPTCGFGADFLSEPGSFSAIASTAEELCFQGAALFLLAVSSRNAGLSSSLSLSSCSPLRSTIPAPPHPPSCLLATKGQETG